MPAVSTSCSRRLRPGSECSWVDQLSLMTHARVRGPAGSTSSPGRPGLVPEVPCSPPALPGDLGPCPWAHGIDQLSRATQARVQAPAVSTPSPGRCGLSSEACGVDHMSRKTCDRVRSPTVSSGFPRRLGPGSKDHRARPALPCYLGLCARHHSSTSCPGCLVPGSEGPRFHQVSRVTSARVQWLAGLLAALHDEGVGPRARWLDHLSLATCIQV